jgi:hypothetical protein
VPEQTGSSDVERGDITRHLLAWSAGDDRAAASAFSALYDTLRRLAARALSAERGDHTLETAGLVNEAFFRLDAARTKQDAPVAGRTSRQVRLVRSSTRLGSNSR